MCIRAREREREREREEAQAKQNVKKITKEELTQGF